VSLAAAQEERRRIRQVPPLYSGKRSQAQGNLSFLPGPKAGLCRVEREIYATHSLVNQAKPFLQILMERSNPNESRGGAAALRQGRHLPRSLPGRPVMRSIGPAGCTPRA